MTGDNTGIEYIASGASAVEAQKKLDAMKKKGTKGAKPYKVEYFVEFTGIKPDTQGQVFAGDRSTDSGRAYDNAMAKTGCNTLAELTDKYAATFKVIGHWGNQPAKKDAKDPSCRSPSGSVIDTTRRTEDLTYKLF
ncbi:hypothetical protein HN695_05450 [Candidatus Woesearchaeota archaeon]|jgi:hypothetical protein|nr:hypothetical protein [Candidatus Woesearchaeota archaeon]MBT5272183.1 hypothetical protein [Candidatus Woesearchaeota archaeon]MBT6040510.1 hypothetical protein [Candidatus Woesearchaeota archaeon]MBT6336889.1 hypothetical protein [Candidatus Woesearchaeota archaeon]MBT7927759.1 hypothetical protein [Candidatus Woesearchaeota archaeon]